MRTLIIGDVHGCSFELRKMISVVLPSKVILVGDLFTKGPDPKGVWDLIQKHKMKAVLGNHDVAFLSSKDNEALLNAPVESRSFIMRSWHFIFWSPDTQYSTKAGFPQDAKAVDWLETTLEKHSGPTALFCHVPQVPGNLDGNYWFEQNPWAAALPYKDRVLDILANHPGIQITFGGHLHWPRLNTLNGIHHITLPSIIESFFSGGAACGSWAEICISDDLAIKIYGHQNLEWKLPLRKYGDKWPTPRLASR